MSKRTLTTPQELHDFAIGKQIYKDGGYLEDCTSEAMKQGFSRMASHCLSMDWEIFNEEPVQAVAFASSEPWNAASANVYPGKAIMPERSGYDYERLRKSSDRVPSVQ